jgi:DivIVA domain-containing protein
VLAELVPEILQPSTFRTVQFRGKFLGGYDPPQVDAFLEKAAEVTALALGALFLPDGTRNPEPAMADIQQLPDLFREARFRRKRGGYSGEKVDLFLSRAAVAAEELAGGLGAPDG